MKALFEVGEEVILVSSMRPEVNGDAVVTDVHLRKRHTSQICKKCVYGYALTIQTEYKGWCECALRKKLGPGESFDSVMQGLKNPIDEPVFIEK